MRYRSSGGDVSPILLAGACATTIALAMAFLGTARREAGEGPLQVCDREIVVFDDRTTGNRIVIGAPVVREAVSGQDDERPVFTATDGGNRPLHMGFTEGQGRWYQIDSDGRVGRVAGPQSCEPIPDGAGIEFGKDAIISEELGPGGDEVAVVSVMAARLGQLAAS